MFTTTGIYTAFRGAPPPPQAAPAGTPTSRHTPADPAERQGGRFGVRVAARPAALLIALAATLPATASAQWLVVSPPAAVAWYAAVDSVRLPGPGAFSFTRSVSPSAHPLTRALTNGRFDLLHFVPLYYPSATRDGLADAADDAATGAPSRAARGALTVGALGQAITDPADRRTLTAFAALVRRMNARPAPASQIAAWQEAWTRRFAPALAPYLRSQRLDAGRLLVIPTLGVEGRIFTGVAADRTDNQIAVGAPLGPTDPDGPLFAAVRELCFPVVSRAADATPAFRRTVRTPADAARRTSIAAVRCGAELLDRLLPAEAAGYRTHWRLAVQASDDATFDALFPADPVLASPVRSLLAQLAPSR